MLVLILLVLGFDDGSKHHVSIQKEIEAQYRQRTRIMVKRDLSAFANTMTREFTLKTERGIILKGKDPYLDVIKMKMQYLTHNAKFKIKFALTEVHRNQVTVTVDEHDFDNPIEKGRKRKRVLHEISLEKWVHTHQGWKTTDVVELGGSYTLDGKIIMKDGKAVGIHTKFRQK